MSCPETVIAKACCDVRFNGSGATPREDTVYCGKLFSRRTVVCPLCVWLHVGWHLHPGRGTGGVPLVPRAMTA